MPLDAVDTSRLKRVKELGKGTFATVDLCELAPGEGGGATQLVAVKRIHPHLAANKREMAAFSNEAELLRKLEHPSIVQLVGVGAAPEDKPERPSTVIVEEYLDGGTLKAALLDQMIGSRVRNRRYSNAEALTWMRQIAEGLAYLHASDPQILYRDLKLENVVLRQSADGGREACLVDFGLSRAVGEQRKAAQDTQNLLKENASGDLQHLSEVVETRADPQHPATALPEKCKRPRLAANLRRYQLTAKTGSLFYMPPEVTRALPYNDKVDTFALGCIMYEVFRRVIMSVIVAGPTMSPQVAEMYALKVADGYRPAVPGDWPEPLQQLIQDAWADKPEDRPDMAQMLQRLAQMEDGGVCADDSWPAAPKGGCACCCVM